MSDPLIRLAAARHSVVKNHPQFAGYAHLPSLIEPAINPPTACIDAAGTIRWHPDFLATHTVVELAFVFVHEILHPLLGHCDPERMPNVEPGLRNRAYDLVVNPLARSLTGSQGPKGALYPAMYGLDEGWTAEQYAEALIAHEKANKPPPPQAGTGVCAGQCGGGAGNPTAGEPSTSKAPPAPPAAAPTPPQPKAGQPAGKPAPGATVPANAAETVLGSASAAAEQRLAGIGVQTAEAIAQNPGALPGDLVREVAARFKVPEPAWDTVLERAMRKSLRSNAFGKHQTYNRPNKMQGALGYGEGVPVLATYSRVDPVVVLVIDTSGSVFHDEKQMGQILGSADDLLRRLAGKSVILSVDTAVRAQTKAKDVVELRKKLKGGGGTNFTSAIEEIEKGKYGPAAMIAVFTDGHATVPKRTPKVPITWALIPGGVKPKGCDYGTVLQIKDVAK